MEVHAAALTRDELEWPVDRLPPIPCYELSGVVVDVADEVERVAVGDPVYALTEFDRDGVAAAYAAVPASLLAPKPSTLDHLQSAAVPLPALSAWQGLFDHGRLHAGQRALVTGAAGGVGQFATQLARWRGAHVVGVASPHSLEAARDLGAHEVVDGSGAGLEDVGPVDLPALRRPGRIRAQPRPRQARQGRPARLRPVAAERAIGARLDRPTST